MKTLFGRSLLTLTTTAVCAASLGYGCSSDPQGNGGQGGSGGSTQTSGGTANGGTAPTPNGGTPATGGTGGTAPTGTGPDANGDGVPDAPPADSQFASDLDYWCRNPDFDVFPICTAQAPTAGPNTDASCDTGESSAGAPCTQDCLDGCGFSRLGAEYCTCGADGLYANCRCLKATKYEGAATAPSCDTIEEAGGSNEITVLDPPGTGSLPCDTVWEQCIGIDPANPTASPPRGCVCLPAIDPVTLEFNMDQLNWICGSTNNWFGPEL
jgi:hypothetical protein